jgi:hypothetical protein
MADSARRKARTETWRLECIAAYGGHCKCCGESGVEFLNFDHVNNDGKRDRKLPGGRRTGIRLYKRLKAESWPSDIQLLCWNCNLSKGLYGECPHIAEARKLLVA